MTRIRVVRQSPSGDVSVLDAKEADVKQFTAACNFVRTFARRGNGPGELTGPSFRMEVNEREVAISDNMLRRNGSQLRRSATLPTIKDARWSTSWALSGDRLHGEGRAERCSRKQELIYLQ